MEVNEQLGKAIRDVRKQRKMTQEQLAARLDISRPTLVKYEKGSVMPSFATLEKIGEILEHDFVNKDFMEIEWQYDFLKHIFSRMGYTLEERFELTTISETEHEKTMMYKNYMHIFNKDHHYKIEPKLIHSMTDLFIEHMKLDLTAFLEVQEDVRKEK